MAESEIHENGISIKLCDICNRYSDFCKAFCNLFPNFPKQINNENNYTLKDIEYIWFTGYIDVGFGKPDITIRFTDGDFFFIEVKTNCKTKPQSNQVSTNTDTNTDTDTDTETETETDTDTDTETKETDGYIGLIHNLGQQVYNSYAFLVDPNHPEFIEETKKINSYEVPIIKWNQVVEIIDKINNSPKTIQDLTKEDIEKFYRLSIFEEDIKNNVDGVIESISKNSIKFYSKDIDFLRDTSLFSKYGAILEKIKDFYKMDSIVMTLPSNEEDNLHQKVDITLSIEHSEKENKPNQLINNMNHKIKKWLPDWGYYLKLEKKYCNEEKPHITHDGSVFIGYNSKVLANKIKDYYPKQEINNIDYSIYALSIAVYYSLIDYTKLSIKQPNNCQLKTDDNNKVIYCKDYDGWYYFPIDDLLDTEKQIPINDVKKRIKYIFLKFLPDDKRRINYGGKNDKQK